MIDIADASEVSRATLYNHYRDKSAVLNALIAAEVEGLVALASRAGTPADALETLSRAVSNDPALASMRIHDADILIEGSRIKEIAKHMRWLLGQVMQPISAKQSREQAELLVDRTLF